MPLKKGRILQRRIEDGVVIVDVEEGVGFILKGNRVLELRPRQWSTS